MEVSVHYRRRDACVPSGRQHTRASLHLWCGIENAPPLGLHCLLNVPNEGAHSNGGVTHIQFADTFEQVIHLVILDDGYHARVHLRPCVGASAGFAAVGAASLHLLKGGKTRNVQFIKHILHPLGVRLIIYNHYTFHVAFVLLVFGCGQESAPP